MCAAKISDILKDAPSNWAKWGEEDEVGAVSYLNTEQVLRGIQSINNGKVFTLGISIGGDSGDPVAPGRPTPQRFMVRDKGHYEAGKVERVAGYGGGESSEDYLLLPLHGTTHFDALGHVWYDDKLFNGFDANTTKGGLEFCSIAPVAEHGVVGRGILADIPRFRNVEHLDNGDRISFQELQDCLDSQGVSVHKRDILLIRTGWIEVFFKGDKKRFFGYGRPTKGKSFALSEPGLTYEKELVEWFHEMEIPALCTDTLGNEQTFSDTCCTHFPLHRALIRDQGMLFGEIFKLDELAEDCSLDSNYEFLFVASPLKIIGGTGSPANPIAIK